MSETEVEITEWFKRQCKLPVDSFPIGIGDDMAEVRLTEDVTVLITTDMLLDGVHFELEETTLEQIGYKSMAVSLSDCAAMATRPICAVVSVALPSGFGVEQLKQLHRGIVKAGQQYNCALAGGDITSWRDGTGRFAVSVAMLSTRVHCEPVGRSGAKAGDCICVTGLLGGSGKGKHLSFVPRVEEAIEITKAATVNSMIDISDGLSTDLHHICKASGLGAIIESAKIPISEDAGKSKNPLDAALNDGEDFELLFTLSQKDCKKLLAQQVISVPLTRIGTITDTCRVQIKMADGQIKDLKAKGYDHLIDN